MKLSRRARYALRMMVELSRHTKDGSAVSLNTVSEHTQISRRYLEQLAIPLKNASLIRGITGKGGGYLLNHSPKSIRIGQIIEAAIGPINIVDCVLYPENCSKADVCECRWVYGTINQRIVDVLHELSLDELANRNITSGLCQNLSFEASGCSTKNNSSSNLCKEDR